MADPPSADDGHPTQALGPVWRALSFERRAAAVGSVLLVVSTFGPFSWVEAAIVLIGLGVLFGLRQRALGKTFHLPAADGTLIAAGGAWAALLIAARLFDRPLGQNLLALACAAILVAAGVRARSSGPDAAPSEAPTERLPSRRT